MNLVLPAVFFAVFAIVLLLSMSFDSSGVQSRKQTKERLDAISLATARDSDDEGLSLLREDLRSSAPRMSQWVQDLQLFAGLRKLLTQADMKWTVLGTVAMSVGSALAVSGAAYLRTEAFLFSAVLGIAGTTGPVLYILFKRSKRFGKFEETLPDALDLMVGAIRAGHSLISAIDIVSGKMPKPIGEEFRKCFDEQNFGLEMRESMLNLAARVPIHDVHIVVTAILIQKESGGNLAEILDKVAYIIRERFRLKRQIRVYTAQGRLTGVILSLLPVVLGIAMYLVNPEHMSVLWKNPTGLKLIYVASAMTLVGGLIIRKIVNIKI